MKILAIGGGGAMGRVVVRTALQYDFVTEVVVAGIDEARATRFVAALGDVRARVLPLDVTDAAALRRAMAAADVVLNTSGPFFHFGVPILTAAIAAGKPYADICDDAEPTRDMLALHDEAVRRGVTAVVGLGASPGLSNLLAAKAAATMDRVDTLVTAWRLAGAANVDDGFNEATTGPDAAVVHFMHCLSGTIPVVQEGKAVQVKPLQTSSIDVPGLGAIELCSIGHPEAVTLPRHFTGLKTCYNGIVGVEAILPGLRAMQGLIDSGQMTVEQAAVRFSADDGRAQRQAQMQARTPPLPPSAAPGVEAGAMPRATTLPGILAFAEGLKNGQPVRAGAWLKHLPAGMSAVTGIPLALFLPLLQQGKVRGPGVTGPEAAIDADAFFALFDPFAGPNGCALTVATSA